MEFVFGFSRIILPCGNCGVSFDQGEELLTLRWQSNRPGNLLPGTQLVLFNECARNGYVLRNRQKIQFWPAQHRERVSDLIQETFRSNSCAAG